MLTREEINKLSAKDLKEYNSLSNPIKKIFADTWRISNESKTENRGRHKKYCECEKCVEKRNIKNNLINETTNETSKENIETKQDFAKVESGIVNSSDGVPKGTEEKTNEENKIPITTNPKTPEEILNDELNQFKIHQNSGEAVKEGEIKIISPEQQKQTIDITQFISGALFLTALDYAFPIFLKYIVGYFNTKYRRINQNAVDKLKLTPDEKKYLEPSAEKLVQYLFADANPIVAFLFCAGSIYGGKFLMLNDTEDFFEPKKKIE